MSHQGDLLRLANCSKAFARLTKMLWLISSIHNFYLNTAIEGSHYKNIM